jgi:hypothetical protein
VHHFAAYRRVWRAPALHNCGYDRLWALGREPQRGSCKQIGGRHLKKAETTPFSFFFCTFFSVWRKQFLFGVGDTERGKEEAPWKKHQIGRERPHFFGLQPPKKSLGSLPPSGAGDGAGCFFHGAAEFRQRHTQAKKHELVRFFLTFSLLDVPLIDGGRF